VSDLAVDVRGLNKSFGPRHVVQDLAIQVGTGKITGFLGPNGSGKTTTLRMLCGLLTPDSGEGQVLGLDFRKDAEAVKRQTGYMTQKFSLYEDLSIEENLDFVARVHELDRRRERHAWPQTAAARRADRRGRSQGAARVLGRDPRPVGRGSDRHGLDPLHGRGRALP
jgi:ABC-type multidrug transport system ATPase subunit